MSLLLVETNEVEKIFPLTSTKFLWDITFGMFTPLERSERLFHSIKLYSMRFEDPVFSLLKEEIKNKYVAGEKINTVINSQYVPYENFSPQINRLGITKEGKFVYLCAEEINFDTIILIANHEIETLIKNYKVEEIKNGVYIESFVDLIKKSPELIKYDTYLIKNDKNFVSPSNNIYINKTAVIQQFVSLQADDGPIIIEKGAKIRPFSIIDGPAFVGKNSLIDCAKIRAGSTIKHMCKIGGEVEASIIESYTNKHHEGYIGNSYVGSWVNIGAMSTTSNLKNNYGRIKLDLDGKIIVTDTIKFGSVICDFAKIGIGVMLGAGTIIREGANLVFGYSFKKYTPPFYWKEGEKYEIGKFINSLKIMMERRNVKMSKAYGNFLKELYKKI